MLKYIIGAAAGGLLGYFVLYRLIGCSGGSCAITANPYISVVYGIILGLLLAGAIGAPAKKAAGKESPAAEYRLISAQEAKNRIDSGTDVIILDVRTQSEYEAEHIPNAILLPNETITDKMPKQLPDLDAEILVYCRSGNRSAQAAKKLITLGYTNVYDFGGINGWPYETQKDTAAE